MYTRDCIYTQIAHVTYCDGIMFKTATLTWYITCMEMLWKSSTISKKYATEKGVMQNGHKMTLFMQHSLVEEQNLINDGEVL